MTIVFAAIAPHGEVLGEEPKGIETRAAIEELGRRHAAADPDATIVFTPHNVHVEGHFAVVTAASLRGRLDEFLPRPDLEPIELEAPVERDLALTIVEDLRSAGIPVVGVSFGGNNPHEAVMPLDWGALVPLAFMQPRAAVVVSPARDRPLEEHVRAGAAVARAGEAKRVAIVASADHGHAHAEDGPYGFDPAAAEYDGRVVELVRDNRLGAVLELEELAGRAAADSLWQMAMLHGALGDGWRAELLSYEAPTYYGMLCAAFART